VTLLSAPAGSGKTMLLSSWLQRRRADGAVAWVAVEREEEDATRFWGMVMDAVRASGAVAPGDPLATLLPAPLGGQDEFLGRLIEGLGRLPGTLVLVLDDLHELRSEDALRGLERLLARAPARLRTVISSRRDPKLGLHRLRLAGALTELRGADLDFSAEEAAELLATAGADVAPGDLARLHQRTEGWAAALRLAALSLARHDAADRFVAEFSGSERTVAEYLVGEVLDSLAPDVRRLLLRTSILERVTGPLADALTGRSDGARHLHELEEANALVVAVDVGRSWFRYHHLLADLLRLELQREAPDEVPGLHRIAARWHDDHGHPVEAIRHALAGRDPELAAELLGRHWAHLLLDGEEATLGALLAGLPADATEADAELAAIAAADRLGRSRWAEADALLASAEHSIGAVPEARRRRAETALATVELLRARRLGGLETVVDRAEALLRGAHGGPAGEELQALALMNLGIAETWTLRLAEARAHVEEGLALGRRTGRPYVEVGCLAALAVIASLAGRSDLAEDPVRQAIAVAERVGWSAQPPAAVPYLTMGSLLIERGQFAEGETWIDRAAPILADAPEPSASVGLRHEQGRLAFVRGRHADALAAFRDGERLAGLLRAPHFLGVVERQWVLRCHLALGEPEPVRAALAEGGEGAFWRSLDARLRLASDDPQGAVDAVAPVLAGKAHVYHPPFEIEAVILDAVARARLGDRERAERGVERALALAEPQGRAFMILTVPGVREVLESHPRHRTAHAGHLATLLDLLAGVEPGGPPAGELDEPLSERELAVLRFLPTNLSAPEIASELILSVHTVKTHMRKLYAKLDVHTRAEAVQRGRALGLLAPARRG